MEELVHGRLMQVQPPLSSSIHISRMGVLPKKHQARKWRLIVDLSSPTGTNINDFVDPGLCSLSYAMQQPSSSWLGREPYWQSLTSSQPIGMSQYTLKTITCWASAGRGNLCGHLSAIWFAFSSESFECYSRCPRMNHC